MALKRVWQKNKSSMKAEDQIKNVSTLFGDNATSGLDRTFAV